MATSARIEELNKKFEENPRRYFAPLANEYRKAGDIDQAIALCREYLPQQPGHMSGHIVYGQALYESRNFEEARTVFETALSLDPENLIALRHLGDIALITADHDSARNWYKRVLEADPRNDEIQAQLASLELAAVSEAKGDAESKAESAPAVGGDAEVGAGAGDSEAVAPDTSAATTVEIPEAVPSEPAPSESVGTAGFIEKSTEAEPPDATEPEPGITPGLEPTVADGMTEPATASALEGLETTSLSSPAADVQAEADVRAASDAGEGPSVVAAASSRSDDSPESDPHAERAPRVSSFGLVIPESETETESQSEDASGAAPESGPFVTETMAELYMQQGHREEALRVYRALAEQRPDDTAVKQKISDLEAFVEAGARRETPSESRPAVASARGETIRALLGRIAARRPSPQPESAPAAEGWTEPAPSASAEPTDAPGETPSADIDSAAMQQPLTSAEASDTPAGGLADLFAGTTVNPADESAASALAAAFSRGNGEQLRHAGLAGTPAHSARQELSLDEVFRTTSASADPASVSFDQFFAQKSSQPGSAGEGAGGESKDEVAQFTRWLEGLKRR